MDEQVVIEKGTYTFESQYGRATVHAPRDVTVGDMIPAVRELLKGVESGDSSRFPSRKECA